MSKIDLDVILFIVINFTLLLYYLEKVKGTSFRKSKMLT